MKEKDMQTLFGHWLKANWFETSAFELKICKEKLFNLKKIEQHQLENLNLVRNGLFYYKIADEGFAQKPFDCITLYQRQAYVVVLFYEPRKPKRFYMIPIKVIKDLISQNIKSIDEKRAFTIAVESEILKN